jgi:uncharacterized protein
VIIRSFEPADLIGAHGLNQANVPAVGDVTIEALGHIVDQSTMALAADDDGDLVGFCLVLAHGADYHSVNYQWFIEQYERFIYLDRVAVAASHRGQGIGAALYSEVERRAALDGDPHWFTLEVNLEPRNDGSLRFHERLGFVEVGQQWTPYGSLVSLMAKPL